MIINWQDIFYLTASLAMIAVFITCIWLMWFSFIFLKLIRNIAAATHLWSNLINDIGYFKKGIKLTILSFLLRIIEKGGNNNE